MSSTTRAATPPRMTSIFLAAGVSLATNALKTMAAFLAVRDRVLPVEEPDRTATNSADVLDRRGSFAVLR